jgi:hypothetical protein
MLLKLRVQLGYQEGVGFQSDFQRRNLLILKHLCLAAARKFRGSVFALVPIPFHE